MPGLGGPFTLKSIKHAEFTGGALDNVYNLSLWTGGATIDGGGGINLVQLLEQSGNVAIADAAITRPGRPNINITPHAPRASPVARGATPSTPPASPATSRWKAARVATR